MTNIAKHQSTKTVKLLLIGHSASGKTGALASLPAAGYKLRVVDFDNGLDILRGYMTDPSSPYVKKNPKCAELVDFVTCTDKMRNLGGNISCLKAEAWQRATELLIHWKYKEDDQVVDLGKVIEWGDDTVLVIDSLSFASNAALNFHLQMNGKLGQTRTQNEARRDIGAAQGHIRNLLGLLYDESVKCHVIVTSHITTGTESGISPSSDEFKEASKSMNGQEVIKGFPSSIGRALSPIIPRYFNTVLLADTIGASHKLFTKTTGNVPVKSTAPLKVKDSYPLESGLAEYFAVVRGLAAP